MIFFIRNLNALLIYLISMILLGGFGFQIFLGEIPCSLCLLQRLGMIGIAFGACLNLRFGIRPLHYALILGMAIFGGSVSLRQIFLHICPNFPTYGTPFWGLSLYTWAFLTFTSTLLFVALLLLLQTGTPKDHPTKINPFGKGAFLLIALITLANGITTFFQCGLGFCLD